MVLILKTSEKARVCSQSEMPSDRRPGAISANKIAGANVEVGESKEIVFARSPDKSRPPQQVCTCALCLLSEPAHEVGGIGRQKEISGCKQVDVREIVCVQADAIDTAR